MLFPTTSKDLKSYLSKSFLSSIMLITKKLEQMDDIVNHNDLRYQLERHGLNPEFLWLIFLHLKTEQAKGLVGTYIIANALSKILD